MTAETIGPNVRRLIARRMSIDAIPPGRGFVAGLEFLSSKQNITDAATRAKNWVRTAIRAVREARDPNPWRLSDDETIAGFLLQEIAKRETVNG
jgi:hypothetical protein